MNIRPLHDRDVYKRQLYNGRGKDVSRRERKRGLKPRDWSLQHEATQHEAEANGQGLSLIHIFLAWHLAQAVEEYLDKL